MEHFRRIVRVTGASQRSNNKFKCELIRNHISFISSYLQSNKLCISKHDIQKTIRL